MQDKTAIVLIPVYQRPQVTLFCMDAMAKTCAEALRYGWDLQPCYVGDDGWMFVSAEERYFSALCRANDNGIGWKMNSALEFYGDNYRFKWDWLITLGSDDLVRPEIFASANYMAAEGFKFFGTNDCILYDWNTGNAKRHNSGAQVIGAGRFVHRSLVEQCEYRLWPDEAMSGLDGQSEQRIEYVTGEYIQHLPATQPFIVDVKSDVNIHSYADIPGSQVSRQRLYKLFPILESIDRTGGVNP